MTEYAKVTVKFYNGYEKLVGLLPEDILFYRQVTPDEHTEVLHMSGIWVYANTQKPVEELRKLDKIEEGIYHVAGAASDEEEALTWLKEQQA